MKESKQDKTHLPLYGVGPIYCITIIIMTVVSIILSFGGGIPPGHYSFLKIPFLAVGIFLIVCGVIMWVAAVVFAKIDVNIGDNHLVTTGIYAYVGNPLYSAFMMACTGVILCYNNL
ncbi:MAG: hypothetical protein VB078_03515 [Clostridiaceae bacterium]|nr:hypothetical protein [Clostridiaceae bacterium]